MVWVLVTLCTLLWAVKFWLIPRLNINWDEFYFLSQIHAAARHELSQGLQTAYTHLFTWLTRLPGDEITQIRAARTLMVVLLGVSALLVQRLATRWFSSTAAWTAALAFLAMWPTLKHGGSFRADSLLLPLHLAALVVLTHPRLHDSKRGLGAGLLLGIATAISIKSVLLAPVVVALGIGELREWRRGLVRLTWAAAAALATTALLLGAHWLTISGQSAPAGTAAQGAWQKTIHSTPWLPQLQTLRALVREDLIFWLVAGAGLGWALWRRLWPAAACALALLPVVFYRNSFAYYYVVMWGPACITIAAAAAGLLEVTSRAARPLLTHAVIAAFAALLGLQGVLQLPRMSVPRQIQQRELIVAVHTIFPSPVTYIDHSGMIASFRKANFFMSSWGIERYLSVGRPFMPRAIADLAPPLLLGNRSVLIPRTLSYSRLLQQDQEAIESSYLPYWGPIRVAGAATVLNGVKPEILRLPFAGNYRLDASRPILISGSTTNPGAVIAVSMEHLDISVAADPGTAVGPQTVRLIWADAHPPPINPPTSLSYYDLLEPAT
jgi:hypothetical protein